MFLKNYLNIKMKVIKGNIWDGFKKINILSSNDYSSYYKVKNINTLFWS